MSLASTDHDRQPSARSGERSAPSLAELVSMTARSASARPTAGLNKPIVAAAPPRPYHRPQDEEAFVIAGTPIPIVVAVDDDRRVRQSIQSVVESAGYATLAFATAEQFLQSGALAEASCLIADVRMPGMNGIELQRRARLERPLLPVIFISGHADDDVRRHALADGAVTFLYKPFDAAALLSIIDGVLKKCAS
jgi:CheY-like chemotaxis protein